MDTSEIFVKMCDCDEIQKQWNCNRGDWYHDMGGVIQGDNHISQRGICMIEKDGEYLAGYFNAGKAIYLPRQDQIQEMLPEKNCKCSCCLVYHLNRFVEDNIEGFFDAKIESLEQYWLAFYMWEKYQKFWDSKKEQWVKSETE